MHIGGFKFGLLFKLVLLTCLITRAYAQVSSVTATITDTDGQTWNNGKWTATLYNPFPANPPSINGVPLSNAQLNLSGTLSNSGVLAANFSDNSFISPSGTQWQITICPNASVQCSTGLTPIVGSTPNLSTVFSSFTKPIRTPASPTAYAYLDFEISPIPIPGGQYFNVTSLTGRVWNGTTWQSSGGGSSGVTQTYNPASGQLVNFVSGSAASIGAPFSITGFTCSQCGNFELGYSISSASGAASYANPTVPTSASVTDGTNVVTLTTPFTSWTESHTYAVNTNFTLTAIGNSQTQTATQSFAVYPCKFIGVGTGGTASGATASGSGAGNQCASETATLSGATATLISAGLGNTNAGDSYTFNPSGQYIYLLLTGGCGHTLYFNGFPTTFNTTAITYTNILGGSQSGMCIYSSPTSYTATGTNVTVHSL